MCYSSNLRPQVTVSLWPLEAEGFLHHWTSEQREGRLSEGPGLELQKELWPLSSLEEKCALVRQVPLGDSGLHTELCTGKVGATWSQLTPRPPRHPRELCVVMPLSEALPSFQM